MNIQAYRPSMFVSVEQILSEMQYADVCVMRNFREYVCNHLIDVRHLPQSLKAHFRQTLRHLASVDLPQNEPKHTC